MIMGHGVSPSSCRDNPLQNRENISYRTRCGIRVNTITQGTRISAGLGYSGSRRHRAGRRPLPARLTLVAGIAVRRGWLLEYPPLRVVTLSVKFDYRGNRRAPD